MYHRLNASGGRFIMNWGRQRKGSGGGHLPERTRHREAHATRIQEWKARSSHIQLPQEACHDAAAQPPGQLRQHLRSRAWGAGSRGQLSEEGSQTHSVPAILCPWPPRRGCPASARCPGPFLAPLPTPPLSHLRGHARQQGRHLSKDGRVQPPAERARRRAAAQEVYELRVATEGEGEGGGAVSRRRDRGARAGWEGASVPPLRGSMRRVGASCGVKRQSWSSQPRRQRALQHIFMKTAPSPAHLAHIVHHPPVVGAEGRRHRQEQPAGRAGGGGAGAAVGGGMASMGERRGPRGHSGRCQAKRASASASARPAASFLPTCWLRAGARAARRSAGR